jgi:hypothetical protein
MAYMFVIVAINLVPYVGPLLMPLILPSLVVVLANGYRAIQRGGGIGMVALTYGIQKRRIELIRLGGLQLIGSLLVLLVSSIIEGGPMTLADPGKAVDAGEMLARLARLMIIALPVAAAFWFAPLLTAWDEVAPTKAVFFSFVTCWRNWRAFIVYGLTIILVGGVLLILASVISDAVLSLVLRMLFLFIIVPVVLVSTFISYQDAFHGKADGD